MGTAATFQYSVETEGIVNGEEHRDLDFLNYIVFRHCINDKEF